jgi:hypothetical protein
VPAANTFERCAALAARTPEERALLARAAAFDRWGKTPDRAAALAPAHAARDARWLNQVRDEFPDLDDATALKMAESRRRAFYVRIARKSAEARRARRHADALDAQVAEGLAGDAA